MAIVSSTDPVLSSFLFYATVVILKMMFMSFATAFYRLTKKVFSNPEDCKGFERSGKRLTPVMNDADVERVRRCHLNDLENIVPFVLIGLLYTLTGPDLYLAKLHFRIFTGARILHTLAYLIPIRQPVRGVAFFVGVLTTISMAVAVLKNANF
ncbi:hypothetical protein LOTGIDRAFT_178277 [Lottia gigantea]|uniref:Microsomal glutathione S-transferase 1 n=1 Tax=Lottia gigantea TaxID=225164 RepID=V4AMS5_LOTGI|nr:hypothetical protein LOTGIDRAFT_178277 [Lottia gigantea]ESO96075.1 hypothetical protein LOTGIDRAFT_178277 [Lottia gigantea]